MPICTRTIERWVCDRCGEKEDFPDPHGQTAGESGWIKIDLTRSLQGMPYLFFKNEQVLCPQDVLSLREWLNQKG